MMFFHYTIYHFSRAQEVSADIIRKIILLSTRSDLGSEQLCLDYQKKPMKLFRTAKLHFCKKWDIFNDDTIDFHCRYAQKTQLSGEGDICRISPCITGTGKLKIRYQSHVPVPILAEGITVFAAYESLNLGGYNPQSDDSDTYKM